MPSLEKFQLLLHVTGFKTRRTNLAIRQTLLEHVDNLHTLTPIVVQ